MRRRQTRKLGRGGEMTVYILKCPPTLNIGVWEGVRWRRQNPVLIPNLKQDRIFWRDFHQFLLPTPYKITIFLHLDHKNMTRASHRMTSKTAYRDFT